MNLRERLKPYVKILKVASLVTGSTLFVAYHVTQTHRSLSRIINPSVLDREKKYSPQYIYIDDPLYNMRVSQLRDKQSAAYVGFSRIWKSLKHSLAWRLLWLCRHGSREQRNVALSQLAAYHTDNPWEYCKLAQALDARSAVLLARTRGADLRYFLPPPLHVRRAAAAADLVSFKLRDMILTINNLNPHRCIEHFLCKYFGNLQDHDVEVDSIPAKPDSISEKDLCVVCLDALHHHISLFHDKKYSEDESAIKLIKMGLLPRVAELFLRYKNSPEMDMAIIRLLTVLSIHKNLLVEFFQNGLIGHLSRLIRSSDVRLSSSAAVCLANLSGEFSYQPGLFLMHPIYRTRHPHTCDTLLVHGLRGGVFVTWRQRDRTSSEPIGIMAATASDIDRKQTIICEDSNSLPNVTDPELREVIEDIMELEEEQLLAEFEVVLHDLPILAKREPEPIAPRKYTAFRKRIALTEEQHDHCHYTYCWPKDWLPKDCRHLRILGVNYWSSLSEWLERCPLQTADIATRASELVPALVDAGVGRKDVPVVWLAHSMGGLIVKQLLVEAAHEDEPQRRKLSENTRAVLFYSTPHKGSALATMPRATAAILWPSNDVRQLQENSPTLLDLNEAFIKMADSYKWETICFAETKPTLVTAFKVPVSIVEPSSADLGRGSFYEMPLDHLSICKPATRQSVLYTTVLDVLFRVTHKNEQLRYSNPMLQWVMEGFYWLLRKRAIKLLDSMDSDDGQGSDNLSWLEQVLLDAFTDGFTD